MDRFQYKKVEAKNWAGLSTEELNSLGYRGWELIQMDKTDRAYGSTVKYIFKRKLNDTKSK